MIVQLRRAAVFTLAGLSVLALATPAHAANDGASCVGIIVSSQAMAGDLDVNYFKDLAKDEDAPTFGQFVQGGARMHEGSVKACLPD